VREALHRRERLQCTAVLTLPHKHLGFVDGTTEPAQTCKRKIGTGRARYGKQVVTLH